MPPQRGREHGAHGLGGREREERGDDELVEVLERVDDVARDAQRVAVFAQVVEQVRLAREAHDLPPSATEGTRTRTRTRTRRASAERA